MLKDAKTKLDALVKDGKMTKADEQKVLKDLEQRIDDLVNAQLRLRFREHRGFGFRHDFDRDGPPGAPSGDPLGPAA